MDNQKMRMKILQDSFLRERVFGFRELSEEKTAARMDHLGLKLKGPFYCVVLFAPYLMEKDADEIDLILMRMLSGVQDGYRRAGFQNYAISDTYCNVVGILSVSTEDEYRKLIKQTQRITNEMMKHNDVDMFVGIGEMVEQISCLNRSKDSAAEALAHKFTFSEHNVITARDVRRYYNQSDLDLKMHYDWIMGSFYDGNMELLTSRVQNLLAVVSERSENELDMVRNVTIELTATLLRVVREMGVERSPEMDGIYTFIAQMESVKDIGQWFLAYCSGMMQKVGELRKDKTQQILDLADQYVEENLGDPALTIQSISDYVDLSAPYFSLIFYRARGIHITEYINRARVKRAQKLLRDTNERVALISQRLGFSSPSYFNTVFKRYTGTTPKNYRETGS